MQEKEQKISPIKHRILQFAESLNISKRDFYAKIGVSRGTLEANSGITEDVMAKFIAVFPDISLDWLIMGKGPMLRDKQPAPEPTTVVYKRDPRDIELISTQRQLLAAYQQGFGSGGLGSGQVFAPFADSP
jgi:hypothetical protein